jgi:tetratricopeptide (TPR) repeat protein
MRRSPPTAPTRARISCARVLIKQGELAGADAAIIEAVAQEPANPQFLDALGYLNAARGQTERALAAYRMAIDANPADGFAWYNTGVILFNQGELAAAADAFYGAGLAYVKSGNYGQAGKALADLRDLAAEGLDLGREIDVLSGALADLSPKG